jgi:hypothetical protein
MRKRLLLAVLCIAAAFNVFADANYVYHERTTNNPGCGPNYVSNLTPAATDAVVLAFKVEYQFYTNQARIYYTTDGTTPSGSFGTPSGTTQVLTASYNCTFSSGGTVDVATATIPAQAAGTTVKYIISAWNSGGGDEIFANGPGSPCGCGTPTNNASLALVFNYTVSGVLPITFGSITAAKNNTAVNLSWQVLTQIDITSFQVEKSADGIHFNTAATIANTVSGNYSWIDINPTTGNNYYRVKAIGKDGEITYSAVTSISSTFQVANVAVYPNPIVNNNIHLQLTELPADDYNVRIYNAAGQIVYTTKLAYNGGNNAQTIVPNVSLAKGIYQLNVKGNQSSYNVKLYVQ